MRILIIRHGDPDYENDTLTEKGHREAALLAERLAGEDIKEIYVSPLGRARATAEYTLKKKGMEATVCPWLEEFPILIDRPDMSDGKKHGIWDWLPADWTVVDEFYDKDKWADVPIFKEAGVREVYEQVIAGLDKLLAEHGYERDGRYYRVTKPNSDTIAFFCHFGLECVLLSHLFGISPMPLWHGFCAPTTSVTTVYTEERRRGIASFRAFGFGDISHLYAGGEPAAFAARWCETYDTPGQRR